MSKIIKAERVYDWSGKYTDCPPFADLADVLAKMYNVPPDQLVFNVTVSTAKVEETHVSQSSDEGVDYVVCSKCALRMTVNESLNHTH